MHGDYNEYHFMVQQAKDTVVIVRNLCCEIATIATENFRNRDMKKCQITEQKKTE